MRRPSCRPASSHSLRGHKLSRFQDITLSWKGRTYTIAANRVFGAIARVEEHIFLGELAKGGQGNIPLTRASRAWAALLDYAGCPGVNPEDIYADIFGNGQETRDAMTGLRVLELIMIPPARLMAEEKEAGKEVPIAAASPNNASVRRSATSGARKKTSGRSRR